MYAYFIFNNYPVSGGLFHMGFCMIYIYIYIHMIYNPLINYYKVFLLRFSIFSWESTTMTILLLFVGFYLFLREVLSVIVHCTFKRIFTCSGHLSFSSLLNIHLFLNLCLMRSELSTICLLVFISPFNQ